MKTVSPADHVERRPIEALIPYAKNARLHSDEQVAQLAASMREWGWTNPVLVDEAGVIIAGHGRVLAAKLLGMTEVPVMTARGWTDAQKRAYVIADNKLAMNASWDMKMLAEELGALDTGELDLALIGFAAADLESILTWQASRMSGLTDPDDAPEVPVEPVAKAGEVWRCGRHRVMCGSATDPAHVATLFAGAAPHLMVTDPPYGVEYRPDWRNEAAADALSMGKRGRATGKVFNDERADWREAWALFPGDVAYIWHADLRSIEVAQSLAAVGFDIRSQIIWAKSSLVISRGHYHPQHESCWYAVRAGKTGHWQGDRKQTTLWHIDKNQKNETGHSTQKPVECMRRPIENNSKPGQLVYDPFVGSGTTLIGAEQTGRTCYAMELSPAYVDVTVTRWQNFTGEKAVRD